MRKTAASPEPTGFAVRRLGRTFAAVSLALSAVLYSAWMLQFPLHVGADPVHAYASELAAGSGPDHWLFASTDLAAGLLAVVAAAAMSLSGAVPRPFTPRIAWLGLASFGAATAVDSLLPLPCRPHLDAGCAGRQAAHPLPITDALHTVTSSAAIAGLLVATLCFTSRTQRGTLAHRAGVAISIVSVASTVWTIAEVVLDDTAPTGEQVGLAQRTQLVALALAVAYVAWLSWTGRNRPPGGKKRPSALQPEDLTERSARCRLRHLPQRRRDADPHQHLGPGLAVQQCGDELTGDFELGHVSHRAGGKAGHRALQQHR